MIESEGIAESVKIWRTDVTAKVINALGMEKLMFEAAAPKVLPGILKTHFTHR